MQVRDKSTDFLGNVYLNEEVICSQLVTYKELIYQSTDSTIVKIARLFKEYSKIFIYHGNNRSFHYLHSVKKF